jgi:hypothetical protein
MAAVNPVASRAAPAAPAAPAPSVALASSDDDFDMEIERNVAGTSMPTATSGRPAGMSSGRPSGAPRVAGTGLELAEPSRMAREERARRASSHEPGLGLRIGGAALSFAIAGGTLLGLVTKLHRSGASNIMRALPHAFDGTSAPESGAVALVALFVGVVLAFVGLKLRPNAWVLVGSAALMTLLALAMVTVTLASTGENPTPPDGALLVPYLFPAALLLLALGLVLRAARSFAWSRGGRRALALPLAALAGAIAYAAADGSRFFR